MDRTAWALQQKLTVDPIKKDVMAKTIRLEERLQQRRTEPPAPYALPGAGSMLGNYLIINQIGEGGMGMVYKARDTVLDRIVALKILPPQLTQNTDFLHRIRTEAFAQARLNHPNIVTLYSVQDLPAGFMLVMEYVEGQTLQQRIQDQGPLDSREAVRIFEQTLQGVAYAHQMGVLHRDLKPDNIFLTHKGEVKIMDFGVARLVDGKESTRSRSMVGTLLYISPEQINGRDADFRSDIYTLGISLFEAVTGRLPFERKTDYALMHAHVLETPPRPRNIKRDLPKDLESVILKAIEKEPEKRHQSAADFRELLLRQGGRRGLLSLAVHGERAESSRWAGRFTAGQRLLGGLRFDLLLVAAVVMLALTLGLRPGQQRPLDDVEPVTHLTRKAKPAAGSAPLRREQASSSEKSVPSSPPSRDRYDALRKAWGG